jgi:uncharacterized protein with PQ loop repeat
MNTTVLPTVTEFFNASLCNCTEAHKPVPFWLIQTFGAAGGIFLAVALIPQVFKTWQTRNATDLSYLWQGLYIFGLCLSIIYLVWEGAIVGWIALIVETILAVVLVILKVVLDRNAEKRLRSRRALDLLPGGGARDSSDPLCHLPVPRIVRFYPVGGVGQQPPYTPSQKWLTDTLSSVVTAAAPSHILSTHSSCLAPAAVTSAPSATTGAALEAAGGGALPLQVSLHTEGGSLVVAVYRSRLRTLDFVFTAQKGCPLYAALFPAIRRLADTVLAQYPGCQYMEETYDAGEESSSSSSSAAAPASR